MITTWTLIVAGALCQGYAYRNDATIDVHELECPQLTLTACPLAYLEIGGKPIPVTGCYRSDDTYYVQTR